MALELQTIVAQFKIKGGSDRNAQKHAVIDGNGHGKAEAAKAHLVALRVQTDAGKEESGFKES